MIENSSGLYAAFKAKDARFDGRFFVGISSTGIYCRPVCRARQPKKENCNFFLTAAEAEQAGYRPCLLCRPELAPRVSTTDAAANLAYQAARMLEENCGGGQSLEEIAERLGCSARHLRRVFTAQYHVPPVQYLQTCRLLLAKNLLTDTNLPVLEVAMTAGFGSLRRFNDLFKKKYSLSPTALRKLTAEKKENHSITLALGYRPPYQWEEMLNFLSRRRVKGIEVVRNGEYMRTVLLKKADGTPVQGWVQVGHKPENNTLIVTVNETLLPVLPQVLARVRRLFDLYCDPYMVYETLQVMNNIQPGLCVLGTRVPGCFDSFEMAVRAVLEQQVTVKAADVLTARMVAAYGVAIQTNIDGLTHAFPLPEVILGLGKDITNQMGMFDIMAAHATTICELAKILTEGKINFDFSSQPEEEMRKLMQIGGIDRWTAQYIAMRAMQWPDAFLETDASVKKALQPFTSEELLKISEEWRPWRSYATINLWNCL